jgi:hypothetical protein
MKIPKINHCGVSSDAPHYHLDRLERPRATAASQLMVRHTMAVYAKEHKELLVLTRELIIWRIL